MRAGEGQEPGGRIALDFETRSDVDIKWGVYRYAETPRFQPLLMAWAYQEGGRWTPVQSTGDTGRMRAVVQEALDAGVTFVAHNAQFERVVCSWLVRGPEGVRNPIDPVWFSDTMARGAYLGYPASLKHLAKALGVAEKDEAGTRLINYFCKPVSRDQPDVFREGDSAPDKWEAFVRYCEQDVDTLTEIDDALPELPDDEAAVYLTDQRVNDRGIRIDLSSSAALWDMYQEGVQERQDYVARVTGVENPNSLVQVKAWLSERLGCDVPSMRAEDVTSLLAEEGLPKDVRGVLEARQFTALVAAKKYAAFLEAAGSDSRARGCLRYFGTHTGRWSGKGVQVHNMAGRKFSGPASSAALLADTLVGGSPDGPTLKYLVRPMIEGPFTVCDFSQIEARVLPWLVGDAEGLQVFLDGRDLYTEEAARMGPQFTRQQGKIASLACQYGGGVGALRNFGGEAMVPAGEDPDRYLQGVITAWRAAHPRVTRLWSDLEEDFVACRGRFVSDGRGTRGMCLPSGRVLWYRDVRKGWSQRFDRPEYTCAGGRPGQRQVVNRMLLCNNLVQATARDVLARCLVELERRGLEVAFHVHDEIVAYGDGPEVGATMQEVMEAGFSWTDGLPLQAEPYTCLRYHKE